MHKNPLATLIQDVFNYFLDKGDINFAKKAEACVRIHTGKLNKTGDLSFPLKKGVWRRILENHEALLREQSLKLLDENISNKTEAIDDFLHSSALWTFPVERLAFEKDRCLLFLQRKLIIPKIIHMLNQHNENFVYGQKCKDPLKRIFIRKLLELDGTEDCSLHRVKVIQNVLRRVLQYSDWDVLEQPDNSDSKSLELRVCSLSGPEANQTTETLQHNKIIIKCGIMIDTTTGKRAKLTTQEYIDLRANEMRLMAIHKYGIRAKDGQRFCGIIEKLGKAAVTVDMLEVKCSSPAHLVQNGQGCTKGASFILYNSARLETLLRTFALRVQEGVYPPLPNLNDVDLSLLDEEEEWQMAYTYVAGFPRLLELCVEQLEGGNCAVHLIIRFLEGLVSIFSVYYRRVRILTSSREHLQPRFQARLHLIKAVRDILNKTLALLDIEPMQFM